MSLLKISFPLDKLTILTKGYTFRESNTILIFASRPQGYKFFVMLNSAEHKILSAHKYKSIKKFSFFPAQISLQCYFSCSYMFKCQQLFNFNKFSCSDELSMKLFNNLRANMNQSQFKGKTNRSKLFLYTTDPILSL